MVVNRLRVSSTVDPDLWEKLSKLSKKTRVPMAQLLDEAIADLIKKYGKEK